MLKERLIEALDRRPSSLTMLRHMEILPGRIRLDLAGHILKQAGYHLQSANYGETRLPLNAPLIDKVWFEYEYGAEIPATARQVWAQEYGEKEAYELPFYSSHADRLGTYWWDDLNEVSARHVIAFMRGEKDLYNLNGPYKGEK